MSTRQQRKIRKYKREAEYSYTLGMAPTIELIRQKRDQVQKIYVHPDYRPKADSPVIYDICQEAGLPWEENLKIFNRLAFKDNVFVLGVFEKYEAPIAAGKPHAVLVNPSDAGNLGTIIRTGLGFGLLDLVIVRPAVDLFEPKVIRASMGALFSIRFHQADSFEAYREKFPRHKLYLFMLEGKTNIKEIKTRPRAPFALVFGNEAQGLPVHFGDYGESVVIKHTSQIDSLNLSVAFGIAANAFFT